MIITNLFLLLFSSALTLRKESTIYYSRLVIISLILSSIICYNNLYVIYLDKGVGLYGGIFNVTSITQSFSIFILLISAIILIYNSFYHRTFIKNNIKDVEGLPLNSGGWANGLTTQQVVRLYIKEMSTQATNFSSKYNPVLDGTILGEGNDTFKLGIYKIIEYPLVILFIICGALFLMSSGDLISVFISIELQSYGLYILSTLHRDSEQATWGGLTYFLLGGLSSCFILLGSALLYINSGTTSLDGLYIISTISDISAQNNITGELGVGTRLPVTFDYYYLNLSLIFISVGFLFKVSAAPFHFWSPDVYDAIPTAVTTYVAIIAKISIFVFLLELVYYINGDVSTPMSITYTSSWKNCILISSLLSLIIGSVLGLTQFRIKKVYAYSTINHVGFILLALCVNNTESIQAYIFYIISYTISNLNAFIILVTIGYTLYLYVDRTKIEEMSLKAKSSTITINNNKSLNINLKGQNSIEQSKDLFLNETKIDKESLKSTLTDIEVRNNDLRLHQEQRAQLNKNLKDITNSPVQLVSQLKGYFYINSYLALSLTITLFSFIGIPPLIGFFAKQMVLSAALDNGFIFITLVGILTSVIGAVYYLNIVKQIFFYKSDYIISPTLNKYNFFGTLKTWLNPYTKNDKSAKHGLLIFNSNDIKINSCLSSVISILTLILLLFIFIPNESFNLAKILAVLLFN